MTRIRDDHGGSGAAGLPAAGLAAEQPPGVRRAASPGARAMGAAPEALQGLARGKPPGPSGSGRRVRLRTAPADILGLPQAMHESIATALSPGHRAMLACSHPDLRNSLRGISLSDKAVVRSRNVASLEEFRAVLQDVQSMLPGRPDLQARPLAVLAGRIGALQDALDDRVPAFDAILETTMQVPAGRRGPMGMPLMMLAGQVVTLALAEQAGTLRRLLRAQEPPGSQVEGLHLLAGRTEDRPEAAGPLAYTQVLQWAGRLEPGPARELVDRLEGLPRAARAPAFFGLLQTCGSLEPGLCTERLKVLADRSGWLPEPCRLQAIQGVLATAGSLAPEQRWAVLKPLGQVIYRLPDAEHASSWQAVVRSCLAVAPGQLAAALAHVHDQIGTLWNAGEEQRLTVPLMPAVLLELETLNKATAALPEEARPPQWQAILQSVEQLPPEAGVRLFEPMAAQIGELPMPDRAAAFEGLLQAHRRLPAQHRVLSMIALGTGCLALPRVQWPRILDRVLEEPAGVSGLPGRERGLMVLAIKFCLAEPAAHGPIDPARPDGPSLDVRVRCLDKILVLMPPPPHSPGIFLDGLNVLNTELERRLPQRPDDAAVLAELIECLRRFRG